MVLTTMLILIKLSKHAWKDIMLHAYYSGKIYEIVLMKNISVIMFFKMKS